MRDQEQWEEMHGCTRLNELQGLYMNMIIMFIFGSSFEQCSHKGNTFEFLLEPYTSELGTMSMPEYPCMRG